METKTISLKELKKTNKQRKKRMELWIEILNLEYELDRLAKLENEIKKLKKRLKKYEKNN